MTNDSQKIEHRSPNYYVKRRLMRNKPAMFGLFIIILATVVSMLGYLVMPDRTPNANDGAVQIQKLMPGESALLLKVRKNMEIDDNNIFSTALFGQESPYILVPINEYRVEDYTIYVRTVSSPNKETEYELINVVKPVYVGESDKLNASGDVFTIQGDAAKYIDIRGDVQSITRQELLEEFEDENIEDRTFILGTDKAGRDMFSRLLFGARISMAIGFVSVIISMLLGILMGSLAGFFGGAVDNIILWFMSVIWSIPGIMLVIAISLALQSRGVWVAFIAVGLTMWVDVARVVRGQILSVKEKLYVEAARAFGIKNMQIIYKHILPNILGPLIVIATANFAAAILLEAGLSFLGLSVQPPTPSWGIMIYEGYHAIGSPNSWPLVVLPGAAICLMVLAFNLLGNGLRDAYDPKTMLK
ncbi:MAG: ABC transporter permease [Cyclobacteriaceae bacterium]